MQLSLGDERRSLAQRGDALSKGRHELCEPQRHDARHLAPAYGVDDDLCEFKQCDGALR